jgi:hypothetical protein
MALFRIFQGWGKCFTSKSTAFLEAFYTENIPFNNVKTSAFQARKNTRFSLWNKRDFVILHPHIMSK